MTYRDTEFIEMAKDILSRGDTLRCRASGSSMYPFIRDGDLITVEPVAASQIRYADIIFFQSDEGRVVVHRVVKIRRGEGTTCMVTRGDTMRRTDGCLDGRSLLGRITTIEKGGRVLPVARGAWRMASVLYTAALPFSKWAILLALLPFRRRAYHPTAAKPADAYYKDGARNALIYEEAKDIIRAFNSQGIRTIVLKGIFLAENIYKNIALRPMTDIDILIRKEDLARAGSLLNALGYPSPPQYTGFLKIGFPCSVNSMMYTADNPLKPSIHIHWHIINSTWPLDALVAGIDMNTIWRSARPVRINNVETLTLSPEHLIIYLAHHGLNHSFNKTIMVSDIALTVRNYGSQIDWDTVMQEGEKFGLAFIVYAALKYVSKVSGLDIPRLEELKPVRLGYLEKAIMEDLKRGNCSYRLSYVSYLAAHRRAFDRLRFLIKTILPPKYILSHGMNIPLSEVKAAHYLARYRSILYQAAFPPGSLNAMLERRKAKRNEYGGEKK